MSEIKTVWGFSATTPGAQGFNDAAVQREKARQFEAHARRIAEAGPVPNEVVVRLVDRGVDPSIDGRVFAWVTEL